MVNRKTTSTKSKNSKKIKCEFCNKELQNEDSLIRHNCEKKKRWLKKEEPLYKTGYICFKRFWEISYPRTKQKTYIDFISSRYFSSFIKLADFLVTESFNNIEAYMNFLVKNNIAIGRWCEKTTLENFIENIVYRESIEDSYLKSINYIKQWAEDRESSILGFYLNCPTPELIRLFRAGKISPWIVFLEEGHKILERFDSDEMDQLSVILDPIKWSKKLSLNKQRMDNVNQLLKKELNG